MEPPASPVPSPSFAPLVALEVRDEELWAELEGRGYRVRGLERNTSAEVMRVNLLARRDTAVHVDSLDLYQARQRTAFVAAAAQELGVSKNVVAADLGRLLLSLERHHEQAVSKVDQDETPKLSEPERAEALELLRDPRLLERILADFERAGLVGEETNKRPVASGTSAPFAYLAPGTTGRIPPTNTSWWPSGRR